MWDWDGRCKQTVEVINRHSCVGERGHLRWGKLWGDIFAVNGRSDDRSVHSAGFFLVVLAWQDNQLSCPIRLGELVSNDRLEFVPGRGHWAQH